MLTFSLSMFPATIIFYPPGTVVELHGDPVIGSEDRAVPPPAGAIIFSPQPLPPSVAIPWGGGGAYVESESQGRGSRSEVHRQPEGSRTWLVHTPASPGAVGVDWLVVWGSRLLRVTAAPATTDGWALWQTPCSEVV